MSRRLSFALSLILLLAVANPGDVQAGEGRSLAGLLDAATAVADAAGARSRCRQVDVARKAACHMRSVSRLTRAGGRLRGQLPAIPDLRRADESTAPNPFE